MIDVASQKGQYIPRHPEKYVGNPNRIVFRSLWERTFMEWCDISESVTRWASEEDFQAWLASPAFAHGHRPHGGDSSPVSAHSELWSFDVAQQEAPRPA